ncbi:MAG: 5-histidylcysteine sulfoxide synthase [Halothiobacillaceae bacterium]|nr:5-histidylcysteine sulfoxide synthase [Halothiobacillaceae bacterium]
MTTTLFPRSPRLDNPDVEALRAQIRQYFHATCDRYEQLFEVLTSDAAYYEKPIALRHPLIFYFGHTATFFTNKLVLAGLFESRIDPRLESLFAVGVDEMSWDDLNEANYDWPTVEAVRAYRRELRARVDRLILESPLTSPITWSHPWWAILMGIEHERIHLETSSVLIRQHRLHHVRPHPAWEPCRESGPAPKNDWVSVPGGAVHLGRERFDPYYGWDNEYGRHEVEVADFEAGRYLVSNAEFLAFVEAGGYADGHFWDEEGARWRDYTRATHPSFWSRGMEGWSLRLMCEEVPMPWNWPVEVNAHEARAFCRWMSSRTGKPVRLPTEDEWYRMVAVAGLQELPDAAPASAWIHLDHGASSGPVDRYAHGPFFDLVGNVWQWTETPIYPLEGFEVHPLYDDFTTPTFDERHNLIKGGSWISCGNEARLGSRYAFRRHFFQHAGFRYVSGEPPVSPPPSRYETDALLSQYAEFHYGDRHFGVDNFPAALAALALEAYGDGPRQRALDIGCAAGRASFELARHFEQVTGIDFSARLIGLGVQMAEQGRIRYTLPDEGELVSYHERALADFDLDTTRARVSFAQGDACNLKQIHSGYDLVLAANLIDRLYAPERFLRAIGSRMHSGGLLVIATPCTWQTEHTPREAWIGGFKRDGENFTTFDGLRELLDAEFELIRVPFELPFVLRETRRKFQHTLSEVTLWRRR